MEIVRGRLITFEGPEGGGKTTQQEMLRRHLEKQGWRPLCLREPGATMVSERIRALLLDPSLGGVSARTEALLFCASRAELVESRIRPALGAGQVVLCDRYTDSTLAYQGYGRGLPLDRLAEANAFATAGLQPDLTLLLDLPVEVGLRRKREASETNRMEAQGLGFHRRVREGFLTLAAADPNRWRVIDATLPPGAVAQQVRQHVDVLLKEALEHETDHKHRQ